MSARDRARLWLRRGGLSLDTPFLIDLARDVVTEHAASYPGFEAELRRQARAALAAGAESRSWWGAVSALAFVGEDRDLALLRETARRAPALAEAVSAASWEIRRRVR